jgi:hypothetical protein
MGSMPERSANILIFCFFAVLVFLAKFPILTVPLYWDEMGWAHQAHWLSGVNLLRALPGLRPPDAFWGHPPALHLTLAMLAKVFGYSIVLAHLIAVCFAFIGVWFTFLLGRLLYDAKTGFFAALFLLLSPVYFAQSGMFLADMPVAALGVASIYFALRRNFLAYVLTATYMVFIKETSIALLGALLVYLFLMTKPKAKNSLFYLLKYSIPLFLIGLFFVWQKLTTGYFFFIYPPSIDIKLFELTPQLIYRQFVTISHWLFIAQQRYIFWALIVLNLIVNRVTRCRSELWLFLLICVFSGYSFALLFFLLRYLLPVLPYIYLVGTGSLLELAGRKAWKIPAATALLLLSTWSLATQPFTGNAEFNLKYLDVVSAHKEMCEYIASQFPQARIATDWPHILELLHPHLGYVKKRLRALSVPTRDLTSLEDEPARLNVDLILLSTTPASTQSEELKTYALKHNWRLIKRVVNEPVATELYGPD